MIFHVTSRDHMKRGSYDMMGKCMSSSSLLEKGLMEDRIERMTLCVNTIPSLIYVRFMEVEI